MFKIDRCRRSWLLCAVALALSAVGCTHSVTIVRPTDGTYTDPITTMQVKFDKDCQASTFQANLSGTNITSLFETPVAGGTSTAALVYPPNFMDGDLNNNVQHLVVDAEFTTPTSGPGNRITRDSSNFTPPYVAVYRGRTSFDHDLTLHERETIDATVFVERAPKERLRVVVTGNSLVSLNNQPAGQDIEVWIMPNDRRADFTVRGIQAGGEVFRIRGIATGYSSKVAGGFVHANQ